MKKTIAYFLVLIIILSVFTGCERVPDSGSEDGSATSLVDPDRLSKLTEQLGNIRMDGSTSTIPLEAGIRSALLGISTEEAEKQVSHSTTYGSFEKLVKGELDIIFTVPISQQQSDFAASQKFEYETFPIAMEGFVFVVNKDNPIESLTQQQIKDIYSGKITNWKDVGGKDAEIVAYQRNETSGSQNYMVAFMGDTPLMKPKTKIIPGVMSELMDVVASYDNGINSIGYSVYSYAAEMYAGANNVKFIKVDGIKPDKTTMADGSYPLLSYNYAIINKKTATDSPVRILVDWILSTPGQKAVADSGYIPVAKINSSLEQTIVKPLTSLGTGEEKPADFKVPSTYYSVDSDSYLKYKEKKVGALTEFYDYRIEGLKNKTLQDEINSFIKQAEADANAMKSEAKTYALSTFEYGYFFGLQVESVCRNGYLSVLVSMTYDDGSATTLQYYYKPFCFVWDLYTGKRLTFTDMFWKGEDFITTVNAGIREKLNTSYNGYQFYVLSRDFWALPENFDSFTLDNVCFASKDGALVHGAGIDYTLQCMEMLVTSRERDMKDIWVENCPVKQEYYSYSFTDFGISTKYNDTNVFWMLDAEKLGMDEAVAAKINNYMKKQIEDNLTSEALDARFGKDNYLLDSYPPDIAFYIYGKEYIIYSGEATYCYKNNNKTYFDVIISAVFDYKTGKKLTFDDILSEGWKNEIKWNENKSYNIGDLTLIDFNNIDSLNKTVTITAYYAKTGERVLFTVPYKYQRFFK
jgi:ABC-type phosphate transport system substrate-binding protein